jgi:hypothetical protein
MPESVPTIMFCGFPVSVAAEPAFDPKATASRNGMGGRSASSTMRRTSGVIMRHTVSLTRKADSAPAESARPHSSVTGLETEVTTFQLAQRKKPASVR